MSYGLERDQFDQIIIDYKKKYNVNQKVEFTPHVMREIAFEYKKLLAKYSIEFEEEPFAQLKKAIISVFNSGIPSVPRHTANICILLMNGELL